jgi:2-polyprenyl-6-methoxyphenol hydroxylase-like FAD-dependent oxidoreductase
MTSTMTHRSVPPVRTNVIVVGGGPCGLMLANELGRRGVSAVLINDKPGTAFNPQANATQARTMEHFRRLGFADEIRALGLPEDFPTDIAYFTRFAKHELARFSLPSAKEAKEQVTSLSGSWSAAELPHRVSQKYVEAALRRHAEKLPSISIHYGWRLNAFRDEGGHVEADVECVATGARQTVHGSYLVGADGPRSTVRQQMGWRYAGETGVQRDFMGGRMYAIYARCPTFYEVVPHKAAWMNVSFNRERRAFMAAVDGKGEFAFHTQLRSDEREEDVTEERAREMFQAAVGVNVPVEILSQGTWTAGHCLVAEKFQSGRVFIAGDAAHLFTPTGGLGYNTAVEDAVNLGWKLSAVLAGQASDVLLATYEEERRPVAVRNTGYARGFADSLGLFEPAEGIEGDSSDSTDARLKAGEYLAAHGRLEFNIPGVTFGGRYDGSRAVLSDGTAPPPDAANSYVPTACPGGRAPHMWLTDSVSLYDRFGFEWTLLRLGGRAENIRLFVDAARHRALPLTVLDLPDAAARALYGADLVLVRPDQIVAWRGDSADDPASIYSSLLGAATTAVMGPRKESAKHE